MPQRQPCRAYQGTLCATLASVGAHAYRGVMSTDDKPATATSDEMKRKFKAALDKKNAQSREGEAHLDGDSSIHGTHGAVTKREFRRKSG